LFGEKKDRVREVKPFTPINPVFIPFPIEGEWRGGEGREVAIIMRKYPSFSSCPPLF